VDAASRAAVLRDRIAGHKAEIRRRRALLARDAAELVKLDREDLASQGIELVVVKKGEGREAPWPKQETASSTSTR